MLNRPEDQLEQLLGLTLEQLDIPDHLYLEAVDEYQAVGTSLCHRYESVTNPGCEVYVQGRFAWGPSSARSTTATSTTWTWCAAGTWPRSPSPRRT